MSKTQSEVAFYLVANRSDIGMWYLSEGRWWTRRKDQALRFPTQEEAEAARSQSSWVEKHVEQPNAADAT